MGRTLSIFSLVVLLLSTGCNEKKDIPTPASQPTVETMTYPDWITPDYVMGHFDPATHPDFIKIPTSYADRAGLYLRKEAWEAYAKLHAAAKEAGHTMTIRSATRNFDYQKGIWERKWNGTTTLSDGTKASDISDLTERAKKILLYSSMPGTSRHHWGTDLDINSFENDYFASGKGGDLFKWLQDNAGSYGFCQAYIDKSNGRTGYEEERWHWTYTPLSSVLTSYCESNLKDDQITGFQGSEAAIPVEMVRNYVLGINPACI